MKRVGVGVGAIIVHNGKILLQRRANVFGSGTWSTPGGALEFGETSLACAAREAAEETGVTVAAQRVIATTEDLLIDDGRHYITLWVLCDYVGGDARVAAEYECDIVEWRSPGDLPERLFLPFKNLLLAVDLEALV